MANYKGLRDRIHICRNCDAEITFRGYSHGHLYCNNQCNAEHKHKRAMEKARCLFEEGKLNRRKVIYLLLVERDGNQCSICKIQDWNGKPIRFWVDHKDGNAGNNSPDNFQLVCPNCDSQSDTFGAKNFGNGRKSRGMKMYD